MNTNIPVLYSLRAIAILSVCFCHYFTAPLFQTDPCYYGRFGVEMFFVISGFVIPWAMYNGGYTFNSFFSFLFKRFIRLEPSYMVSIIAALVILWIRHSYLNHAYTETPCVTQVALHFGYLIPFFKQYDWLINIYWSLAIEFQFYIFIALLYVPLLKGKIWARIPFYLFSVIAPYFFGYGFLPPYFPCFMLGILLFLKKIKHVSVTEFYIATVALLAFCFYKYAIGFGTYTTVATVAIAFLENKDFKFLNPIGKISYSIYLFHTVTGGSLILLLYKHAETPVLKMVLVVAAFAVTMVSSYIMYLFVERPARRVAGRVKYK